MNDLLNEIGLQYEINRTYITLYKGDWLRINRTLWFYP